MPITNCTGRPLLPGSGDGRNAAERAPAIWPSFIWTCGCSSIEVRFRSSQGLNTMPPKAIFNPFAPANWNTWSVSGYDVKMSNTCRVESSVCSSVASGEAVVRAMMIPWSSCGASSLFEVA